jgi:hypothetical protein
MGAWGPDIFADDLACDIREEFRDLIAEGLSPEDATTKLQSEYDLEDDPDQRPLFYLALAATQWKLGRLLDDIRDEALRIIDSGEEIERWKSLLIDEDDIGSIKRRQAALDKLRAQLLKPQPKPKKIRLPYASRTDWEIGYAVAYRLLSGRYIVLRVIGIDEGRRHRHAIVDLPDWVGDRPPEPSEIAGLPGRRYAHDMHAPVQLTESEIMERFEAALQKFGERSREALTVVYGGLLEQQAQGQPRAYTPRNAAFELYEQKAGEIPIERLTVIATDLPAPPAPECGGSVFGGWRELDRFLREDFELH